MKSIFEEIGFGRVNKLMAEATAEAARENAALGLPVSVKLDGAWHAKLPGGRVLLLTDRPSV